MTAPLHALPKSSLRSIEALRAAAALAVVAYHTAETIAAPPAGPAPLQNGAAGVDVFFVISGFVMVVSARRLQGRADAAWRFLRARLRRIVPLYWLCSAAKILCLLAAPAAAKTTLTIGVCAASLLFLPVHDAAGRFRPVLPAGWTLSFEMLFYTLFAASLAARRPPELAVPPMLAVLVLLPYAGVGLGGLGNPILLEFALGIMLASLWSRGWRLPAALAWPVLAAAAALLLGMPKLALGGRLLSWGLPAASLVAAAVSLERHLAPRLPKTVLALGAASYAIYLTHGFVLAGLGHAWAGMPRQLALVLPVALAASAACGCAVHAAIEKPLLGQTGKLSFPGRPPVVLVLAGGGLSPLSGGVGTLMRNLQEAWAVSDASPRLRIVDTRGPGGIALAVPYFAASLLLTAWLCATGGANLVHAHMTTRGSAVRKVLLCSLAMALRVPVILHMHGADFIPFHRRLHPALRWPLDAVLRRARCTVVLGAGWRDVLVQEAGVSPGRICIVPNGVPQPPARQGREGAPPSLLFLGRLCRRKGLPELIAALGTPALRQMCWQATIAGDGNAAPYRAMLNWHGLQSRVSLPGWTGRDETARLLAGADILVLPSHHEGLPIAVLEALAAGVAVITTPVGAIGEFLEDGVSALLVPPGDPLALADAILRLLEDPGLRARLAEAGHRVFRDRFDIAHAAGRLAALYADATRTPEPGPSGKARGLALWPMPRPDRGPPA